MPLYNSHIKDIICKISAFKTAVLKDSLRPISCWDFYADKWPFYKCIFSQNIRTMFLCSNWQVPWTYCRRPQKKYLDTARMSQACSLRIITDDHSSQFYEVSKPQLTW